MTTDRLVDLALGPDREAFRAELAQFVGGLLKREGFRMVVGTGDGTYWRHRDGRMCMLTRDRKGDVTIVSLTKEN